MDLRDGGKHLLLLRRLCSRLHRLRHRLLLLRRLSRLRHRLILLLLHSLHRLLLLRLHGLLLNLHGLLLHLYRLLLHLCRLLLHLHRRRLRGLLLRLAGEGGDERRHRLRGLFRLRGLLHRLSRLFHGLSRLFRLHGLHGHLLDDLLNNLLGHLGELHQMKHVVLDHVEVARRTRLLIQEEGLREASLSLVVQTDLSTDQNMHAS